MKWMVPKQCGEDKVERWGLESASATTEEGTAATISASAG